MCYNSSVSLFTFLTGISGAIALYNNNLKSESLFLGWVSNMQLIDYFIWNNQPCQITENNKICSSKELQLCNQTNQNATTAGMIINHLEPVVLFVSILIFSNKTLPMWVIILTLFFFIILFIYSINIINNKKTIEQKCTYVTDTSNPYLWWQWNYYNEPYNKLIYSIFLIIFTILVYHGFYYSNFSAIITLLSYLLSIFIYGNKKATGNLWCFAAAYLPWILYLYHKIQ